MARKHGPHASLEEKQRLISLYYESSDTTSAFCQKHGITQSSFFRWKKEYDSMLAKVTRPEKSTEDVLRTEILKLRIENERLKKNYTVKLTKDGKMEFVRLRTKNTK